MDTVMQSLIRQYAANPGDNILAQRIANMLLRGGEAELDLSFDDKVKRYQETAGVLRDELCDAVGVEIQQSLSQYPDVLGVRWTQYTPHFNDGNECVFGVHDPYVRFKDTPESAGDLGDGYIGEYDLPSDYNRTLKKTIYRTEEAAARANIIAKIRENITKIPDEIMRDAFGDHRQVTITPDSIDADEYEHD